MTWKIETFILYTLIFNKVKYLLKMDVMKHIVRKRRNSWSCNKHLYGFKKHFELMMYSDFGGRLLNLLFQNLDSSSRSEQDENLRTGRPSYYKSYTFLLKHLLLATLSTNGPDGCWIWFFLEISMFPTLKLYFFSWYYYYYLLFNFVTVYPPIPVERTPVK